MTLWSWCLLVKPAIKRQLAFFGPMGWLVSPTGRGCRPEVVWYLQLVQNSTIF